MPVYKVLGDRIKKIRLENNMTQQQFAEALGYTHKSMINKIETGQTDISFDVVIRLILEFNVNAAEFLDLSDAETNRLMDDAYISNIIESVFLFIHHTNYFNLS